MHDIEQVLESYVETALWSSSDNADENGGEPLDENYGTDDIAPDALQKMREDCVNFLEYAADDLALSELGDAAIGHNFWLNRNGHGAGFWDLGLDDVGDRLSDAAKSFGSVDLYVGNDGKIYQY